MSTFENSLKIKPKKDLYDSLKSMQNDKSPGKDGLTKEFYEKFWNKRKEIFIDSVSETKEKRHLKVVSHTFLLVCF